MKNNRNFICIENNMNYYKETINRIEEYKKELSMKYIPKSIF